MPSKSSSTKPNKSKSVSTALVLENKQPIPPQRITRSTMNHSEELKKLTSGQSYRIKDHDLYRRMCAAAHTQNSQRGGAYVCRWIGPFGRIWNAAKPPSAKSKRR